MTDAIPQNIWLLVPAARHTRATDVRLFRKRSPMMDIGIVQKEGYAITTLERTLVESLAERRRLGSNIALEALRRALKQKMTTLHRVIEMANHLGVARRIMPYLEALS